MSDTFTKNEQKIKPFKLSRCGNE